MYDACDVLHVSHCSADVVNHVLREYGGGNMGQGIRRLAGEMLTIGGQRSYSLGYDDGAADIYPTAFKYGAITGAIVCACTVGLLGFGVWCTQKLTDRHENRKEKVLPHIKGVEEVRNNVQE